LNRQNVAVIRHGVFSPSAFFYIQKRITAPQAANRHSYHTLARNTGDEAGITDHVWSLAAVVARIAETFITSDNSLPSLHAFHLPASSTTAKQLMFLD
jgi:hypothetical protein